MHDFGKLGHEKGWAAEEVPPQTMFRSMFFDKQFNGVEITLAVRDLVAAL